MKTSQLDLQLDTFKESKPIGNSENIENTSANPDGKVPIRYYVNIFKSSILIILICVVGSTGIAYLITNRITPTYQVTTTIQVSKANLEQAHYYDTIRIIQDMASYYALLITNRDILDQVRTNLDLDISYADLKKIIKVNYISNTQLIEIRVEHPDPEMAVKIANNLVEVFSDKIEKVQLETTTTIDNTQKLQKNDLENEIKQLQDQLEEHSLQVYNQRVNTLNTKISDIKKQIEQVNEEMAPLQAKSQNKLSLTATEQLELSNAQTRKDEFYQLLFQYQEELVSLIAQGPTFDSQDIESRQSSALLDQYQAVLLNLIQNYQTMSVSGTQDRITISQIDRPLQPEDPIRPNLMINLVLGLSMGLMLAALYIFFTRIGV